MLLFIVQTLLYAYRLLAYSFQAASCIGERRGNAPRLKKLVLISPPHRIIELNARPLKNEYLVFEKNLVKSLFLDI